MLYDPQSCPCLNVDCDLYMNCEECINRHHSSRKYPLTAYLTSLIRKLTMLVPTSVSTCNHSTIYYVV